ncbi:MAG: phosphatase PAP2 family protein [Thermoleophilia bacterium]
MTAPTRGIADIPVLRPRAPGTGVRERILRRRPPAAAVYAGCLLAGMLVLCALAVVLGLALVHVVLPAGAGRPDEHAVEWVARHRSATLNTWSLRGSRIGDAPVLPALVLLGAGVALLLRRARVALFLVGAGAAELVAYRVTSLVVHRERPGVARLDHLPADQSFPSGHTGAAVAVYCGLMLVVGSRWPRLRVLWPVAVAIPVLVGLSRIERGMHHPLDVLGGALVGAGAIAVGLFATRAAVAAHRRRTGAGPSRRTVGRG